MAQILTKINSVSSVLKHGDFSRNIFPLKIESALKETTNIVFNELSTLIKKYSPKEYWDIILYSIQNKQYFERAYYIRLSYENFKSDWLSILPVLAAVELKYSELVIIDDILDGNSERLNKPSIPVKCGVNKAIVIGCIIKSISSKIMIDYFIANKSINKDIALQILSKDEYSHQVIYEGQYDDVSTESMQIHNLSQDFYLDMVRKTTGEDVAYCFEVGALLAGCRSDISTSFYEFGLGLGTIMQMRDDTIDYINDGSIINKKPFTDLDHQKKRLPLLLAYEKSDIDQKRKLEKLLVKKHLSEDDKLFVSELVFQDEVLDYIDLIILSIKNKALDHLKGIEKSNLFSEVIDEIFNKIILLR